MRVIVLLTFIFSLSSWGNNSELLWEKFFIEDKVKDKITQALTTTLTRSEFIVTTKIKLKRLPPPNFPENPVSSPLKLSDKNMMDQGDYIAFSKVGLEVPILEKYNRKQKFKDYFKTRHQFESNKNLFKLIKSATAKVILDSGLSEEKANIAKTLVQSIDLSIGPVEFELEFTSATMKVLKKKQDLNAVAAPKVETREEKIDRYIARFANGIGLFLSTLLFGILAFLLLRQYGKILRERKEGEAQQEQAQAIQMQQQEEKERQKQEQQAAAAAAAQGPHKDIHLQGGLKRFQSYYQSSQSASINMVKRWIEEGTEKSKPVLAYLAQNLENEVLLGMFDHITTNQRSKWKDIIEDCSDHEMDEHGDTLLNEAMVREITGGDIVSDSELLDLLIAITAQEGAKFIQENQDLSAPFLTCLSSQKASEIFNLIDINEAESLLTAGGQLNTSQIPWKKLRNALTQYCSIGGHNPFFEKVQAMLPSASIDREALLYKSLASKFPQETLINLGKNLFPASAINNLDDVTLKHFLLDYPMKEKIEMLLSLEDEKRTSYIELFAEKGSNARDMLDYEFKIIRSDKEKLAEIEQERDKHWNSFVTFIRENTGVEDIQDGLSIALNSYLKEFYQENENSNVVPLKKTG